MVSWYRTREKEKGKLCEKEEEKLGEIAPRTYFHKYSFVLSVFNASHSQQSIPFHPRKEMSTYTIQVGTKLQMSTYTNEMKCLKTILMFYLYRHKV